MRYYFRTLKTSFRALCRNIMRSGLTTLGIVIGIAAVITIVEIGQGTSTAIKKTIASMGANNILVIPGAASSGGVSFGAGSVITLTPEDGKALMDKARCPSIDSVAPVVRARTQVVYGNKNWTPTFIYGTTANFLKVRQWEELDKGNVFDDRDVNNMANVCLLGQTVVRELFQDEDPIGKTVRIQNKPFKVVGTLTKKGANMMGIDQDDILLAPWTTIKAQVANQTLANTNQSATTTTTDPTQMVNTLNTPYPGTGQAGLFSAPSPLQTADTPSPPRFKNVDQLLVSATSTAEIKPAIQEMTAVLHEQHHIKPGQPDDFSIRDMTEMMNAMGSAAVTMKWMLLIVAMVSLVVGGVGIMNIMLVSVTERTREIGLRMAVGARAIDILLQFLVEAVLLCIAGGLVGIVLGLFASWVVSFFGMPTELSIPAIIVSVVVSVIVGLAFGFYPAWKASRLDPIEALRYE